MGKNKFLKQLEDELYSHPYRDRFLEELEDHLEDLENDEDEKENTKEWTESQIIKEYLGEPEFIKSSFIRIMNPFNKVFLVLEGLFFSALLTPLTIIAEAILSFIIFSQGEFSLEVFSLITFSQGEFRLEHIMIYGLILSGILLFFYWICFKRFSELIFNKDRKPIHWMLLILGINLSIFIYLVIEKNTSALEQEGKFILAILLYLGSNLFLAYLAWRVLRIKKRSKEQQGGIKFKIIGYIKSALLTYFFLSIIVRTILTSSMTAEGLINNPYLEKISPLLDVFSSIIPMELFTYQWWGIIINSTGNEMDLLLAFYLPIFLLIAIGLQSGWVAIREKKWFSLRSLITFYVISLFLIRSQGLTDGQAFKVPMLNISSLIEKHQMGYFYEIFKYFNHEGGKFFRYEVGFQTGEGGENEGFLIKNNINNYTYIPYSALEKGGVKIVYNSPKVNLPTPVYLPRNYYYDRKNKVTPNFNEFVETYIVKNIRFPASDAAFSKDGKWGLVVIPRGALNPEEVYLFSLKNVQPKEIIK